MIRFRVHFLIAVVLGTLGLLALGGCAHLNALVRANDIEREMQKERMSFLETTRDAYLLIGNEYYKLAKLAEARGDARKTKEYSAQASLYAVIYNDLKRRAEDQRASLGERAPEEEFSESDSKAFPEAPDDMNL